MDEVLSKHSKTLSGDRTANHVSAIGLDSKEYLVKVDVSARIPIGAVAL